jgi:hypothetical protein
MSVGEPVYLPKPGRKSSPGRPEEPAEGELTDGVGVEILGAVAD